MAEMLLELFSEEIPARMQHKAAEDLKRIFCEKLKEEKLGFKTVNSYYSPRRLILHIADLESSSADQIEIRKGPSITAPQKAIEGFMRSAGLKDISEAFIQRIENKGDFYSVKIHKKGQAAQEILAGIVKNIILNFPWPKTMSWGNTYGVASPLRWIRPLRNILFLWITHEAASCQSEIIPLEIGDLIANNHSFGHRFMAKNRPLIIKDFEDYVQKLHDNKVIIDPKRRKELILTELKTLAFANNLTLIEDDFLLEEVTGLVEWPVVLLGSFKKEFLKLPQEVIQLTIRKNQKCFVLNENGDERKLSHHYAIIANLSAEDGGQQIIAGNDKVIEARLKDALYFWQKDQENLPDKDRFDSYQEKYPFELYKPLDQRLARLFDLNVVFMEKLGTQGARIERICHLAAKIAEHVGADKALAMRAAYLAKADLQTEMVGEFPELQGFIGHHYALLQGENPEVARAIEEHYKPQGPYDRVPCDKISFCVALADKIDSLVGFWLINEKPTGSKDPYALRRAAIGIIRLLLRQDVSIRLREIFSAGLACYPKDMVEENLLQQNIRREKLLEDLEDFLRDRFKVYLREREINYDIIEAVLVKKQDDFLSAMQHIEILVDFLQTSEGKSLLKSLKRIENLLNSSLNGKEDFLSKEAISIKPELFKVRAEEALFEKWKSLKEKQTQQKERSYLMCLKNLAEFHQTIDDFFENVFILDAEENVRNNRLFLLKNIANYANSLADFTQIVQE